MDIFDSYMSSSFWIGVQNFVIAIIILLVGWLIAKMIAGGIEKGLRKTGLDEKLFNKFQTAKPSFDSAKAISKAIYYMLMVVVFILFFNYLNLNMIASPLASLIETFLTFIPVVLKAILILSLAYIIGMVMQWIVVKAGRKVSIPALLVKAKVADSIERANEYLTTAGRIIFYLILLLFIPGVMDALNIHGVSEPFSGLLTTILSFIPKLLAAVIVFAVGWFIAKIVRSIVTNLLMTVGSEKVVTKLKLTKIFEGTSLAAVVGQVVFILILIPTVITSLDKLELTGITTPAIAMLQQIMEMIPNIIIAIALILVGVWLGRLIGSFVSDFLTRVGFNNITANMQIDELNQNQAKMTPAVVVGYIVQVIIVFFLTVQALYLIKLDFLVAIASAITAYLPHVLAAVIIIGIALILANIVEKILMNVLSGPVITILARFAKYTIIILAVFMALTQLGIATSIVASAFTLILGALALAFGLAFGLGGKEFAAKYLHKFDQAIEETKVKKDEPFE